jgi:hypothetical protein
VHSSEVLMSLLHCPLCIGLGLLSLLRAAAHLLLLQRLLIGPAPRRLRWHLAH